MPNLVPKDTVSTRVVLFDGQVVSGGFFVSEVSSIHAGPETVLDVLNDEERSFIPFQSDSGVLLLNRTTIRMVEVDSHELKDIFLRPDNEYIFAMQIVLRTELKETTYAGCCYTGELHPEARRPVDLLNSRDMFILLFSGGKILLFNKHAISHASVE